MTDDGTRPLESFATAVLSAFFERIHSRFELSGEMVGLTEIGVDAPEVVVYLVEAPVHFTETSTHLHAQIFRVIASKKNACKDRDKWDSYDHDVMHTLSLGKLDAH